MRALLKLYSSQSVTLLVKVTLERYTSGLAVSHLRTGSVGQSVSQSVSQSAYCTASAFAPTRAAVSLLKIFRETTQREILHLSPTRHTSPVHQDPLENATLRAYEKNLKGESHVNLKY